MAWSYDPRARVGAGVATAPGAAPDQRLAALEQRLARLEGATVSRGIVTGDVTASEGDTLLIEGPTGGLRVTLPQPGARNKDARITIVTLNASPVTIRVVNGTVNGQAFLLRGVVGAYVAVCDGTRGWWLPSLMPARPRELDEQDHFIGGNTTSGSIGKLAWNLFGTGTPVVTRTGGASLANGRLNITTSNVANERTTLCLGGSEASGLVSRPDQMEVIQASLLLPALTLERVFFGWAESFATAPASVTNNLGFLYDSGVNGNWHTIHRFGSTGSATDTGVAASTSLTLFTIRQVTTKVYELRIGTQIVATIPQPNQVSVLPLNLGFRVETLTAAAKTLRVGYFGMRSVTIDGALDDDAFLQR